MTPPKIPRNEHPKKIAIALIAVCAFILAYFTTTFLAKYLVANIDSVEAQQIQDQTTVVKIPTVPEPRNTITIQFLGDMMFDRGVRAQINKLGGEFVFASGTQALTQDFDFTVANLEGPITAYKSKTINAAGKGIPGFSFTFPTSTAALLKTSGIDMVSLANNHTDNFGPEGLKQTVQWLKQNNMEYFGNPTNTLNINASGTPLASMSPMTSVHCFKEGLIREQCIALIGYHEFTYKNEGLVLAQIQAIKNKVHYVIVMPHWGTEYKFEPNLTQKNLAHQWIDAGADMVVGAHPHVIQSTEIYKDKYIFYSLGNYIFDQYFSYETTHGMTVGFNFEITNNAIDNSNRLLLKKITYTPIDITNIFVRKANEADTNKMLLKQAEISKKHVPTNIYEGILRGKIEL